jgi:hypothetical protein
MHEGLHPSLRFCTACNSSSLITMVGYSNGLGMDTFTRSLQAIGLLQLSSHFSACCL